MRDRGRASRFRAANYDWDDVADGYEDLCLRLAGRPSPVRDGRSAAVLDLGAAALGHERHDLVVDLDLDVDLDLRALEADDPEYSEPRARWSSR